MKLKAIKLVCITAMSATFIAAGTVVLLDGQKSAGYGAWAAGFMLFITGFDHALGGEP